MMKEWTDRMPGSDAVEVWQRAVDEDTARRTARVEREMRRAVEQQGSVPVGFYEAMRHFLTLRDKLFPSFPTDPAWRILVLLADSPEESGKNSVTGISHGAEIPMTTALRYLAVMEVEGIITRVPHPEDKRQVIIRLTVEGRRRLDAIAERWAARLLVVLAAPSVVLLYVFRAHLGI